jgi:hypothetical protein
VIPIGKNFGQTLQRAIDHRQTGPVFLSPKGEPWSVGNLSRTHRRLRDAAGLPRDLVLYLARHRFGTEALRAGLPLNNVPPKDPSGIRVLSLDGGCYAFSLGALGAGWVVPAAPI